MKRIILALAFLLVSSSAYAQMTAFTTQTNHVWSLDSSGHTLLDGVWVGGGIGSEYKVGGDTLTYVFGGDGNWWYWDADHWVQIAGMPPAPIPVEGSVRIPITEHIAWNHDGKNVDNFALVIDGQRVDLSPITPVGSDPPVYTVPFPEGLDSGIHIISVLAHNTHGDSPDTAILSVKVFQPFPHDPTGLTVVK